MVKYIFPISLIVLDVCAAGVYLCGGDTKKSGLLDSGGSFKYLCNVLRGLTYGSKQ